MKSCRKELFYQREQKGSHVERPEGPQQKISDQTQVTVLEYYSAENTHSPLGVKVKEGRLPHLLLVPCL